MPGRELDYWVEEYVVPPLPWYPAFSRHWGLEIRYVQWHIDKGITFYLG